MSSPGTSWIDSRDSRSPEYRGSTRCVRDARAVSRGNGPAGRQAPGRRENRPRRTRSPVSGRRGRPVGDLTASRRSIRWPHAQNLGSSEQRAHIVCARGQNLFFCSFACGRTTHFMTFLRLRSYAPLRRPAGTDRRRLSRNGTTPALPATGVRVPIYASPSPASRCRCAAGSIPRSRGGAPRRTRALDQAALRPSPPPTFTAIANTARAIPNLHHAIGTNPNRCWAEITLGDRSSKLRIRGSLR